VAGFLALETPRLFRRNGGALVSAGAVRRVSGVGRVLYAAACAESLVDAVARGCAEAGMTLLSIVPAADVIPRALADRQRSGTVAYPDGTGVELIEYADGGSWRSRFVPRQEQRAEAWAVPLEKLGERSDRFAAAYGAAIGARRALSLMPPHAAESRRAGIRRASARLAVAAAVAWVLAAGVWTARIAREDAATTRALAEIAPAAGHAWQARQDLRGASATIAAIDAAAATRSRSVELLARLAGGLSDSVVIVALTSVDSQLQLSAYGTSAAGAVAELERIPGLSRVRLNGPVSRERLRVGTSGTREWERFAVSAILAAR
jgi:hypothetical protein